MATYKYFFNIEDGKEYLINDDFLIMMEYDKELNKTKISLNTSKGIETVHIDSNCIRFLVESSKKHGEYKE